jgi:HEAT repeat protein
MTPMKDIETFLRGGNSRESLEYGAARRSLQEVGEAGIEYLLTIIQGTDESQAWRAIRLIGGIKAVYGPSPFLRALNSSHISVRQMAIQTLGEIGDAEVVPHLLAQLQDESGIVEIAIVDALGELRDRRSVEPLLLLLHQTKSTAVQHSVIRAFGMIGDPTVAVSLLPYFNSPDQHVCSKAREIYFDLTSQMRSANV